MTMDDLLECREFEDVIALGCYPIDLHNPMGRGYDMRLLSILVRHMEYHIGVLFRQRLKISLLQVDAFLQILCRICNSNL
ncbi:FAD-dependent oxidoreductase [Mediterraneibacter gnavus]|uniref:FAD-dependent oxidoreductase n=1 Tax=Mediterraneibacter gnavus TaxID=33038 RepID=UPI0036D30E5C